MYDLICSNLMFQYTKGIIMVYNTCAMHTAQVRNLLLYETQGAANVGQLIHI